MSSLNKVQLIGHLGRDPEVRSFQNGGRVATLSVGTSERWTDKQSGEKRERTEWNRVALHNEHLVKLAEQALRKGSKVYVEGQLQTRKWTDNAGVERFTTEIVVGGYGGALLLLDRREQGQSGSGAGGRSGSESAGRAAGGAFQPDLDDDIPF